MVGVLVLVGACGDNVGAPNIDGVYVADVDHHEKPTSMPCYKHEHVEATLQP